MFLWQNALSYSHQLSHYWVFTGKFPPKIWWHKYLITKVLTSSCK